MTRGPTLALVLGVLAVSSAALLIKLCHAPSLAIAAWRMVIAALGCLLLFAVRRPAVDLRAAWAGLFLGLHFATWISSLAFTTVASSVLLVTTNPIFVALGSTWLLHERVGRKVWVGIALSMAGVVVVGLAQPAGASPAPDPLLGNALALAGAVFGSAYYLVGRRVRSRVHLIMIERGRPRSRRTGQAEPDPADLLGYVTVVYGAAAVLLTALALGFGVALVGFSTHDWVLLVLIAAVPQGIGHTLLNWSLRFVPPSQVAVAILGEPIGAAVLAWVYLREPMTWAQAAGGLLVLAGVALTARKDEVEATSQL